MDDDPSSTLNIPSLLVVLAVGFIVYRYFWRPSSTTWGSGTSPSASQTQAHHAAVEQITQMFPQVGAREVLWDLQRNGGSIQATTERILTSGMLERVSFFLRFPLRLSLLVQLGNGWHLVSVYTAASVVEG